MFFKIAGKFKCEERNQLCKSEVKIDFKIQSS